MYSQQRAVSGALFSHVVAWRSYPVRYRLLDTLSGVDDRSGIHAVLPLLSSLVKEDSEEALWLSSLSTSDQKTFLGQLFQHFTAKTAVLLNDPEGDSWKMFLHFISDDSRSSALCPYLSVYMLNSRRSSRTLQNLGLSTDGFRCICGS